MSQRKRARELTRRLEELFTPPEELSALEPESAASPAASPIQFMRALSEQTSATFLQTLLDRVSDPIYIKDREHKWVAVNAAFCRLIHKEATLLLGHTDKEQSDADWQLDDQVLESGQPGEQRETVEQPDGTPAVRQVTRLPLLNTAGIPGVMLGIIRPVCSPPALTEQSQLSEVLQNLVEGYYEVDLTGNFVAFNHVVCEIYGYTPDELLGMNDRQYTDPETAKLLYATFNQVYRTGKPSKGFDWPIIRRDGTVCHVEASVSLIRDSHDQPVGFRGIVRDITERKAVEQQLRLHTSALESAASGIIITDRNGTIMWVNPAFTALTGYTAQEAVGGNPRILKSGEQDEAFYREMWQTILSGQVWRSEIVNRRKDGSLYTDEMIITPVRTTGGEITHFVAFKQDITERKANEQLQSALYRIAKATEVAQDLSEFYATIHSIVGELMSAKNFYIALYDAATQQVTFPYFVDEVDLPPEPHALGSGLADYVLRTGQPLLASADKFREMQAKGGTELSATRAVDWLGIPLKSGQQTFGALVVQSYEPAIRFGPREQEVLTFVSSHIATTLERRRAELEREQSQARLLESEASFRLLFVDNPQPMLVYDLETLRFLEVNEAMIVHYGYAREEFLQMRISDIRSGEDVAARPDDLAPDYPELQRSSYGRHRLKNGAIIDVEVLSHTLEFGGRKAALVVVEDITDRKRTEGEILRRNVELSTINRLSQDLTRLAGPNEILELIYTGIGEVLDNHNLYIALYDADTQMISFPIYTIDGERREVTSRPYGNGLTEHILRIRAPLFIPHDVQETTDELGIARVGRPAECWMAVPLLAGDKAIGVVALQDYDRPDAYTESHLEVLNIIGSLAATALENARLFEDTQRRLAQQSALLAASTAIASSLDLKTVLNDLAEQMGRAIDVTSAYICDWKPEAGTATVLAEYKSPETTPLEKESDLGATYNLIEDFGDDLEEWLIPGKPVITQVDDPNLYEPTRTHLLQYGGRSVLTVPFVSKGKSIGYVDLWESRRKREFSQEEIALVQGIAQQAAVAFENARLFEETRRRTQELSALNDLAQALSTRLNMDQVLQETYRGLTRLIDTTNFYLGLYDPEQHQVSFVINITESAIDYEIKSISADQGMTGYIIRNRTSILVKDDVNRWFEERGMERVGQAARSWLGVPLVVGDQIIGVMAVQDYEQPNVYDEHDRDLMIALGSQAAIAIQNARLFEQTQHDAERERTINRIAAKIRNAQSVEQVLQIAAQETRLVTGASRSIVKIAPGGEREGHDDNGHTH